MGTTLAIREIGCHKKRRWEKETGDNRKNYCVVFGSHRPHKLCDDKVKGWIIGINGMPDEHVSDRSSLKKVLLLSALRRPHSGPE